MIQKNDDNNKYEELCLVHLSKLGQYINPGEHKNPEEHKNPNFAEQEFFCFGYYDKLACIYNNTDNCFNYKHVFAINYAYKKPVQPILADQLFTMMPIAEGKGDFHNLLNANDGNFPFLGILLLTIIPDYKDEECFQQVVESMGINLNKRIIKNYKSCLVQVCKTANCADLCLVIRTDKIGEIYEIKRDIENLGNDKEKIGIQTMLNIAIVRPDIIKENISALIMKNKDQKLEIRFQCDVPILPELKKLPGNEYGTMGIGEYAIVLKFEDFIKSYPLYYALKSGKNKDDFLNEKDIAVNNFLLQYWDSITFVYERWFIKLRDKSTQLYPVLEEHKESTLIYMEICQKMMNGVNNARDIFTPFLADNFPDHRYAEQIRLIKDLLYTYDDFWYHNSTVVNGILFYAQLETLIRIIHQQKKICTEMNSDYTDVLPVFFEDLITFMDVMVANINNFNKLILAVNQNVRNVPNYEMQSKVNVEKYIYAYTMYLLKICSNYNQSMKKEKMDNTMVFPFFTIDFSCKGIQANTLSPKLDMIENDMEEKNWVTAVIVRCPNYQRMANIYHVLPMITHEISHNFRYMDRKQRNLSVLDYLSKELGSYFTYAIMEEKGKMYLDKKVEFISQHFEECLYDSLLSLLDEKIEKIKLHNLSDWIISALEMLLGVSETRENNVRELCRCVKSNMLKLFELSKCKFYDPNSLEITKLESNSEEIYVNVVLDILASLDDKNDDSYREWSKVLCNYENCPEELTKLLETVNSWKKQGGDVFIPESLILKSVKKMIYLLPGNYNLPSVNKANLQRIIYLLVVACESSFGINELINNVLPDLNSELEKYGMDRDETNEFCLILEEAVENAREIKQVMELVRNTGFRYRQSFIADFAFKLHNKIHTDLISERNELRWLLREESLESLVNLGVVDEKPEQFMRMLKRIMEGIPEEEIRNLIEDKISFYEETFADLGMCVSFDFDAFGYFCYTIHIFMEEKTLQRSRGKNVYAERLKMVIYILCFQSKDNTLNDDNKKYNLNNEKLIELDYEFKEKILEYAHRVLNGISEMYSVYKNYDIIKKMVDTLINNCLEDEWTNELLEFYEYLKINSIPELSKNIKEYYMHIRMLTWMSELYNGMELWGGPKKIQRELFEHFLDGYDILKEKNVFVHSDEEQKIFSDIGEYYNNFSDTVANKEIEKQCMANQNRFVLRYYDESVDLCVKCKKGILTGNESLIKLIFNE